jgi:hypothetical protein
MGNCGTETRSMSLFSPKIANSILVVRSPHQIMMFMGTMNLNIDYNMLLHNDITAGPR